MNVVILDLDNCIADDAWRIPRIQWDEVHPAKRYARYHALAEHDRVGNRDLFEHNELIVVFTSRPMAYHAVTTAWLARHDVACAAVFMRLDGDMRPSVEVKREMLFKLLWHAQITRTDIVCAYDDRSDIVDMYRSCGVRAEIRALHEACAYTRPTAKGG